MTKAEATASGPSTSESPQLNSHWAKDNAEEDRIETLIRKSGCWDQHLAVVDCMGEKRDWRACQEVLNVFRDCMMKGKEAQK